MWVESYTGLMSRCMALADAYELLKTTPATRHRQKSLTVVWLLEDICSTRFEKIFSDRMFSDIDFKVIQSTQFLETVRDEWTVPSPLTFKQSLRYARKSAKHTVKWLMGRDVQREHLIKTGQIIDFHAPESVGWYGQKNKEFKENQYQRILKTKDWDHLYVRAYNGIIYDDNHKRDLSSIIFHERFWEESRKIIGGYDNMVGVHIRRAEHLKSIEESPTDLFVERMDRIIAESPSVRFFLATDDAQEEKDMLLRYGDRIIVQKNKVLERNRDEGIESSIIDCLCLGMCQYVLGSSRSVFSRFAANYQGKPLYMMRKQE